MYTSLCSSLLAFESWLTSKGQNAFRQTMLWMRSLSFFIKTKVQPQSDLQYCLSVVGGFFLGKGCCNCNTFATGGGSISKVYLESYDFSKSSELDFSCNTKMSVALRKNCNTKITRISITNFSVPKKTELSSVNCWSKVIW